MVKNTLTKIAAKEAGVEGLDDLLAGPSAIAFVKGDPVEAAKGLRDFAKANPLLVIKGGVMDGKPLTADEIKKLADLESREVLLAKLAGAMKASLSGAVVAVRGAAVPDRSPASRRCAPKAEPDPSILRGGAGTPAVAEAAGRRGGRRGTPTRPRPTTRPPTAEAAEAEATDESPRPPPTSPADVSRRGRTEPSRRDQPEPTETTEG